MARYLINLWEEEWEKKNLPPEWQKFDAFRAWAVEHGYKVEYGYKGEFTPTGCLAAIPGAAPPEGDKLVLKTPKKATSTKGGTANARKKTNSRSK